MVALSKFQWLVKRAFPALPRLKCHFPLEELDGQTQNTLRLIEIMRVGEHCRVKSLASGWQCATRRYPCRRRNSAWSVPKYREDPRPVDRVDSRVVLDSMAEDAAKRAWGHRYESDLHHRPPSDLRVATCSSSLLPRQPGRESAEKNFDRVVKANIFAERDKGCGRRGEHGDRSWWFSRGTLVR